MKTWFTVEGSLERAPNGLEVHRPTRISTGDAKREVSIWNPNSKSLRRKHRGTFAGVRCDSRESPTEQPTTGIAPVRPDLSW